ncbi:type II/IV secretion system protein [Candidatus Parcubacteria bacterium]|nr:MAG: type II/IV secretion system protein [Candidatus Parcubacteria bacterium]
MVKTFLDFLVEQAFVPKDKINQLKEAVRKGSSLEELLIEQKIVPEGKLFKAKSDFLQMPLRSVVEGEGPQTEVLNKVPEEAAEYYKMVPLAFLNGELMVGMVYPEDVKAQEALKFLSLMGGFHTTVNLITLTDYNRILGTYRSLRGEVNKALEELSESLKKDETIEEVSTYDEKITSETAPISKTVAVVIRHAVDGRASDIHIEPQEKELRVRFRVDGVLHTSLILPKDVHPQIASRIKILSNLRIDERRVPQDGRFRLKIDQKNVDFRVSTFPTSQGEKVVMRILDPSIGIKTLPELGLQGVNLQKLEKGIRRPFGMTLITGPTGSGKSTTLAALLSILNREGVNVVSLEDPIEYYLEGANQSQVRPELQYTFASGLRSILRQDPDVVMVGEIRDTETAELTVHAALTGHVVLSTLHTNDAIGVVPRMADMGIAQFLIPSTLNVALAQRLVRKLCPDCKRKVKPSSTIQQFIEETIKGLSPEVRKVSNINPPYFVYEAPGCPRCGHKGTRGRIGVFEVMEMTPEFEKLILKRPTESEVRAEAQRQGMITMLQDAIIKAVQGEVSFQEAVRVAKEFSLAEVGEGGIQLGGK